jgi:hypothetical protein
MESWRSGGTEPPGELRMRKSALLAVIVLGLYSPVLSLSLHDLDIKTRFGEKFEFRGIKHGVIFYLEKAGFRIVETGEDYCAWLEDMTEDRIDEGTYLVRFSIRITEPSLFLRKAPLADRAVEFRYVYKPTILDSDVGFRDFIREKIRNIDDKDAIRAMIIGEYAAAQIKILLDTLDSNSTR